MLAWIAVLMSASGMPAGLESPQGDCRHMREMGGALQ